MLLAVIYFLAFSLFLTWAVVRTLERREKRYRLGGYYSGDALLAGTGVFISSYVINFVSSFRFREQFLYIQLFMLGCLLAFEKIKEASYRRSAAEITNRLLEEIQEMKGGLKSDPANSAFHERLSELHEKLGDTEKAAAHAATAATLDPTEKNRWRLKTLKQDLEEKTPSSPKQKQSQAGT